MRILRALGPRLLDHEPILAGVLENLRGYSRSSVPEALTTLLAAGPAILGHPVLRAWLFSFPFSGQRYSFDTLMRQITLSLLRHFPDDALDSELAAAVKSAQLLVPGHRQGDDAPVPSVADLWSAEGVAATERALQHTNPNKCADAVAAVHSAVGLLCSGRVQRPLHPTVYGSPEVLEAVSGVAAVVASPGASTVKIVASCGSVECPLTIIEPDGETEGRGLEPPNWPRAV